MRLDGRRDRLLAVERDRAFAPRPTMPMIDLSVVVLPAPLRPSSVTTSPVATSKSMPCRMCDSPYQAFSSRRAVHLEPARLAIPAPR